MNSTALDHVALTRGPSLSQQTYESLKSMIVDGTLQSGLTLSENNLSQRLSISRSPLREAVRQLQDEGLLELSGPHGFRVPPISTEFVKNLYEVRKSLEVTAARLADDIPAADINAAKEQMRSSKSSIDAGEGGHFTRGDFAFHDLYVKHCGNPLLMKLLARLHGPLERVHVFADPLVEHIRASYDEHVEILANIEAGNRDGLAIAVGLHIDGVARRIIQHIDARTTASE